MTISLAPQRVALGATGYRIWTGWTVAILICGVLMPTPSRAVPKKDRSDAQGSADLGLQVSLETQRTDPHSARLHAAVVLADLKTVRGLLKEGARPGFVDEQGQSSLMIAARDGNKAIVRILLKAGASVTQRDNAGRNALHYGAMGGNVSVIKMLSRYPELRKEKDAMGQIPLHLAAGHGHFGGTRALLEAAQVGEVDQLGRSLMFHAYMGGNMSLIKYLKAKKAPTSLLPKDGSSFFLAAVQSDNLTLVTQMVGHTDGPCDVNEVNQNGETALYLAAMRGRSDIVDFLVSQGATPHARTRDGRNLLMAAARLADTTLLNRLIAHGLDVNQVDNQGRTALFDALEASSRNAALLLLQYGARADVADSAGVTPIEIAVRQSDVEMVQQLLQHGAPPVGSGKHGDSLLLTATRIGNEQIVGELLGAGASISTVGDDGTTLLMAASEKGMIDFVRLLLQWGQSASATNQFGQSALDLAKAFDRHEVVSILEQQSAPHRKP
ncbi:MAG: ankyrin repeat domain-containing protein [Deltaproteobacteria bacterium]|nr:ankyrin repeat domain-containing protein [Deltaproteobacteria bacterium]